MTTEIAEIFRSYLDGKWYTDVLTGLVKRIIKDGSYVDVVDGIETTYRVEKSFPAYCQLSQAQCDSGDYMDLVPNDTKASIIYFEDGGSVLLETKNNQYQFESSLRIVGWMNLKRFNASGCSLSQYVVPQIIATIPKSPFNSGNFHTIQLINASEVAKDAGIFARYTYDEPKTQYMMYPFDFFAIDIRVRFWTNKNCFTEFEQIPQGQC